MKRNLLARGLRASGRLLLFAGIMFSLGMTFIKVYIYFYSLQHPGEAVKPISFLPEEQTGAALSSQDAFTTIVVTTLGVLAAAVLIAIIVKIYNKHMRNAIARLAKLFHAQIFTVEVVSTLLAWTIATLLLFFTIPVASIVTTFAFIINELLFIFAWGAYGQPNYKI